MTVILSAHGQDFLVLGADSRATQRGTGGRVQLNNFPKIAVAGKHSAVLMCGEGGPAANLVDLLLERIGTAALSTRQLATVLAKIGQNEARELSDVPTHPAYRPNVGFIVAGLEKPKSRKPEPRSFALSSETGYRLELAKGGFLIDGISLIPRYLFSRQYSDRLSLDDMECLVVGALLETMTIDGDVGGRIRIAMINRAGCREAPLEEIQRVSERWMELHPPVKV